MKLKNLVSTHLYQTVFVSRLLSAFSAKYLRLKGMGLVWLLLSVSGVEAQKAKTPEEMVKEDWPVAVGTFGKQSEKISSHYIFVVDVTEQIFGPVISSQIQSFVDALPANDKVTVIQLGPTNETNQIVPTCDVTPEIKKEIIKKLSIIKFGRTGSDGLAMSDEVIKALKTAGVSNSIPFIFIFSDFEFYLPNTLYRIPPVSQWQSRQSNYQSALKGLKRGNYISISGLRLDNPKQRNDYFDRLQMVFGKITPSTVSGPNLLKAQFNNLKADIYRNRLLNYINDLVQKQNGNLQLENNTEGELVLKSSDTLVYHKLVLDDESRAKVSKVLNSDKWYSFTPPGSVELEVSGTLMAEKFRKELPDLSDVELKNHKITLMVADSRIPWWLTDIILLVLFLVLWRFVWTIIPPARLRGTIDFYQTGKSSEVLECYGRYKKYSNNEVKLLKSGFSIEVRATKTFMNGKCLIIIPTNGDLLLSSAKQRKTARAGKKTIAGVKSQWNIDGVDIIMPGVK